MLKVHVEPLKKLGFNYSQLPFEKISYTGHIHMWFEDILNKV